METLFLKKSTSFTNKLSRAERNLTVTYDDIKARDDIRTNDGRTQILDKREKNIGTVRN